MFGNLPSGQVLAVLPTITDLVSTASVHHPKPVVKPVE